MEEEFVYMAKGTKVTRVLAIHKANYVKSGWKLIDPPAKMQPKDLAVKTVLDKGDNKLANANRGKSPAQDFYIDAEARVATELKQPAPDEYSDGLIKPEADEKDKDKKEKKAKG